MNFVYKLMLTINLVFLFLFMSGQPTTFDNCIDENIKLKDSIENVSEELKSLRNYKNNTMGQLGHIMPLLERNRDTIKSMDTALKKMQYTLTKVKDENISLRNFIMMRDADIQDLKDKLKKLNDNIDWLDNQIKVLNSKNGELNEINEKVMDKLFKLIKTGTPLFLYSPFQMSLDPQTGIPPTRYPINNFEVEFPDRKEVFLKVRVNCAKLALLEGLPPEEILNNPDICNKYKDKIRVSIYKIKGKGGDKDKIKEQDIWHSIMQIKEESSNQLILVSSNFDELSPGRYFFKFRYAPFGSMTGAESVIIGVSDSFKVRR